MNERGKGGKEGRKERREGREEEEAKEFLSYTLSLLLDLSKYRRVERVLGVPSSDNSQGPFFS